MGPGCFQRDTRRYGLRRLVLCTRLRRSPPRPGPQAGNVRGRGTRHPPRRRLTGVRLAGIRLAVYSAADAHGPQADIKGFGFPGGWRPRDESLSLDGLPERLRQVGAVPFGAARHAQYDEGRRFAADKFGAQLLELDARPDEVDRVCVHARRGPARQATAPLSPDRRRFLAGGFCLRPLPLPPVSQGGGTAYQRAIAMIRADAPATADPMFPQCMRLGCRIHGSAHARIVEAHGGNTSSARSQRSRIIRRGAT